MTTASPRVARAAVVAIVAIPLLWALGLDQGTWVAVGLAIGTLSVRARGARMSARLLGAFVVAVVVAGVLGATGLRWMTFAREVAIVLAFAGVVVAMSHAQTARALRAFVVAGLGVVACSSALSILAFGMQEPLRFTTPLAPLVPPFIADTGLGSQSFVERSLAETSYFLGRQFMRPQGLFLFSTSQAVAQAVALPLFVVGSIWYPRWRWLYITGAGLTAVALLVSTTRSAIAALVVSAAAIWLIRRLDVGHITISLPLRGRAGVRTAGGVAAALVFAGAAGLLDPLTDVLTTRSLEGRAALYEMTVETWADRPIIGWGTEVDWTPRPRPSRTPEPTPTLTPTPTPIPTPTVAAPPPELPPLGSHSWYLGVLFKQGLIGFAFLAALMILVLRAVYRCARSKHWERRASAVSVGSALVVGATESLWLDPATAVIVAIPFGLVLAWGTRSEAPRNPHEEGSVSSDSKKVDSGV